MNNSSIFQHIHFSSNIFWDIRIEDLDYEQHAPYVVQRILEYGSDEDWKQLVQLYGLSRIGQIAANLRSLEPRALAFIALITHQSKEKFRCYTTRQSNSELWSY